MCGIGGIINLENKSINLVDGAEIISKTLQHRGPDDEGFYFLKMKKFVPLTEIIHRKNLSTTPLIFLPNNI